VAQLRESVRSNALIRRRDALATRQATSDDCSALQTGRSPDCWPSKAMTGMQPSGGVRPRRTKDRTRLCLEPYSCRAGSFMVQGSPGRFIGPESGLSPVFCSGGTAGGRSVSIGTAVTFKLCSSPFRTGLLPHGNSGSHYGGL